MRIAAVRVYLRLTRPVSDCEKIIMPRPRNRVRLEDGLKLDLNRLVRQGFARRGFSIGPKVIRWTYTYTGEEAASGLLTSNIDSPSAGWIRLQLGKLDQTIYLQPRPRHFGGQQWYFVCPATNRRVSVLWKPPGASRFCSRRTWGQQVAYGSQFQTKFDRAVTAAQRIRTNLAGPEWAPLDGSDPPKPKWMRWRTYDRILARADAYEAIADEHTLRLVVRLGNLS
jgi:hypothetical protein